MPNHIVMLDEYGQILDATAPCPPNARSCTFKYREINDDEHQKYLARQIDAIFAVATDQSDKSRCRNLGVSNEEFGVYPESEGGRVKRKLLLYVHGGLNEQQETLDRAARLAPVILCSGSYPIFINWKSNLISSYFEHLFFVRQGRHMSALNPLALPLFPAYLITDIARGISRMGTSFGQLVLNDYEASRLYQDLFSHEIAEDLQLKAMKNANAIHMSSHELQDQPIVESIHSALTWLITLPSKIGSAPFLDAAGTSAWENMNRRTQVLFNREDQFDLGSSLGERTRRQALASNGNNGGTSPYAWGSAEMPVMGGLMRFLLELEKSIERSHDKIEITIVAHSMGAIVINQMLKSINSDVLGLRSDNISKLPIADIVYMGAACSIQDYQDSVWPYLRTARTAQFYNVMLHEKAEAQDTVPPVIPVLDIDLAPRGSLLVWIDGFLANPNTFLEKTLGRFSNAMRAVHITPDELKKQINFKVFRVGEETLEPQHHLGLTDKWKFWKTECVQARYISPDICRQ